MPKLIEVGRFHIVTSQVQYVQEVSSDRLRVYFVGGQNVDVYTCEADAKRFFEDLDESLQYIPEPYELNQ